MPTWPKSASTQGVCTNPTMRCAPIHRGVGYQAKLSRPPALERDSSAGKMPGTLLVHHKCQRDPSPQCDPICWPYTQQAAKPAAARPASCCVCTYKLQPSTLLLRRHTRQWHTNNFATQHLQQNTKAPLGNPMHRSNALQQHDTQTLPCLDPSQNKQTVCSRALRTPVKAG